MPAFGNPNHSLDNPFKPGKLTVGMQPHNQVNALTGSFQPQATTATVPNTAPTVQRGATFPSRGIGEQRSHNEVQSAIDTLLGGRVRSTQPYVPPSNADLFARLLGLQGDVSALSMPLLDALLGQEARMQGLLEGQDNDLLRQLLEQTSAMPSPRPRSGTSFFRGFSG